MTGLVKAKKYDWKDSNLALFGSDTERNVSSLLRQQEDFKMVQVLLDMCGPFERLRNTEHSEANFT